MTETNRIHLTGPGYSGRAVGYRVLDIDELDEVERALGQEIRTMEHADKMSVAEYQRLFMRIGLPKIVVEFTDPVTPEQFAAREGLKWTAATPQMFDDEAGGLKRFFRAKDVALLRSLFLQEHDVNQREVDRILAGKVVTVA